MSTKLDRATRDEIVDLMIPYCDTQNNRQAFVDQVLYDHPMATRVDYEGNAHAFAIKLLGMLKDETIDGEEAVIVALKEIRKMVGEEKKTQIDAIMAGLRMGGGQKPAAPTSKPAHSADSGPRTQHISGLRGTNINIGGTQTVHGNQYINEDD